MLATITILTFPFRRHLNHRIDPHLLGNRCLGEHLINNGIKLDILGISLFQLARSFVVVFRIKVPHLLDPSQCKWHPLRRPFSSHLSDFI